MYLVPQNIPGALVLTLGNKVVLQHMLDPACISCQVMSSVCHCYLPGYLKLDTMYNSSPASQVDPKCVRGPPSGGSKLDVACISCPASAM